MKTNLSPATIRLLQTQQKKVAEDLATLERQAAAAKQSKRAAKALLKEAEQRHREAKLMAKELKRSVKTLKEELRELSSRVKRATEKRDQKLLRSQPSDGIAPLHGVGADGMTTPLPPINISGADSKPPRDTGIAPE